MIVDEASVHAILEALRDDITEPEAGRRYALALGMAFIAVCALERHDPEAAISAAFDALDRARSCQ
jgi:hypothetical protein